MATQLADQYLVNKVNHTNDAEIKVSTSKNIVVVPDINQGSYNGVISFDAQSQLTGNNKFASLQDTVLVIPYCATMRVSGTLPATAKVFNRFSLAPKFNVCSIVDSISVELNNKTVLTEQSFKQYWANLRAWTETTVDDVKKHGSEKLLYLDDWKSINHAALEATSHSGDGYSNNNLNRVPSTAGSPSNDIDMGEGNNQEPISFNNGFYNRLLNHAPVVVDATESQAAFSWPSMGSKSVKNIAEQTGKNVFKEHAAPASGAGVTTTIVGSWFWTHKIKLTDLHPIFEKLPLTANCQLKIRIRMNQGKFSVLGNSSGYTLTSSIMTSGSTCPLMLSGTQSGCALEGRLVAGTNLEVAYGAIRNEFSNPSVEGTGYYPFNQARLYVPLYELANPSRLISSPVKTVKYLDCYAQMWQKQAGIGVKSDGSQHNAPFTLQASGTFKNVKYVALLPFAETSAGNYFAAHGTPQYQSPVDSAPATLQPGSAIRNFQVEIGGSSVFNSLKEYDFDSYLNEIAKLNAVNGDLSKQFNCGLLDINQWSFANRMLIADCSRMTEKDVPASVVVSGVNGSSQGSDLLLLIVYERELEIDVLTGQIERLD